MTTLALIGELVGLSLTLGGIILTCYKFLKRLDKFDERFTNLDDGQHELHKSTKRLELLNLLNHDRDNIDTILQVYDEYVAMGGNSYMKALVNKWKREKGLND